MGRATRPGYVKGASRQTVADALAALRDVDASGVADEDGLFYNSTTGKWTTTPWTSNPHRREVHISLLSAGAELQY